jgi:hypothetical protein
MNRSATNVLASMVAAFVWAGSVIVILAVLP